METDSSAFSTTPVQPVEDDQGSVSIYYSAKSSLRRFSFSSGRHTDSSGRPSIEGATWSQSFSRTMNSGFGPGGEPRSDGFKGVREGRKVASCREYFESGGPEEAPRLCLMDWLMQRQGTT